MSNRITPLRAEEVIRRLRRLGYQGPVPGGRHARMVHPQARKIIPIPVHSGRDVSVGLIRAILREAGITPEEWNAL